ncbi:sensory box/GGDEF family protein [Vibrio cholerae]|nr:sensory box/GGDEF family protein [Vibrio cholerae]
MIELNRIEELFDNQQFSLHELVLTNWESVSSSKIAAASISMLTL